MIRALFVLLLSFYSMRDFIGAQEAEMEIDKALFWKKVTLKEAEFIIDTSPFLLTWKDDGGRSSLDNALFDDNFGFALALINKGFYKGKDMGDEDTLSTFRMAVCSTISDRNGLPVIKAMLELGVDPMVMIGELDKQSALQRAFCLDPDKPYYDFQGAQENPEGYRELLEMLLNAARKLNLKRGVTVDPTAVPNNPDEIGNSLLHLAAATGNVVGTEILVTQGAPVNARNRYGFTPLHKSVYGEDRRIVTLLLDHGAELETRNEDGDTPLTFAVFNFWADAVAVLLERGARTDLKNNAGKSANDFSEADLTSAIKPYHTEKDIAEMKKAFKEIHALLGKK